VRWQSIRRGARVRAARVRAARGRRRAARHSFLETTARLKPGATLAQAAGEIAALVNSYRATFPDKGDVNYQTP